MNFLAKITLPVEAANKFIKNPEFNQKMDSIMSDLHPKTAYFCVDGGQRTIYAHIDVVNSYDLPKIAEPFWLSFNASVEFIPAMTQEDFGKAMPLINQVVKKYS